MINKVIEFLLLVILFILLTCLFTWPLANNFSNGFLSDGSDSGDFFQYIWNISVLETQLSNFSNPFITDSVFYPESANMLMSTYTPIIGLFSYLFKNNVLAINVFLFLSFILSGVGAYYFSKQYIQNNILCFISGFIFAFSSYKMVHLLGHYNLMLTATIPFMFLSFLNAFDFKEGVFLPKIKSSKHFCFCIILGLITVLSDYYVTFYVLYSMLFYVLYNKFFALVHIDFKNYKTWLKIIAFFTFSHILVRLIRLAGVDDMATFYFQADIVSLFVPYINNAIYPSSLVDTINNKFNLSNPIEGVVFIGFAFFACMLYVFSNYKKVTKNRTISCFIFISLGLFMLIFPGLKIAGKEYLNFPTSIINFIPFINNIRCTSRFFCVLMLFLPIIVFYYFQFISFQNKLYKTILFLLIGILIIVEHLPRKFSIYDTTSFPKAIYRIAKNNTTKVFMPIPTGVCAGTGCLGEIKACYLYYQTIANKKMIGGYTSRVSDKIKLSYSSDSVMSKLFKLKEMDKMNFSLSQKEREIFYLKFKPDVFILEQRNGKYEDFLNILIKDKKFTSLEIDGVRIVELKK